MYDGIYTKYENAKKIITHANALEVITMLEEEISQGNCNAQNYALLSKAYSYLDEFEKSLEYAILSIKKDPEYAYGYARTAYAYAGLKNKKLALKYSKITESLANENYYILNLLAIVECKLDLKVENSQIFEKIINLNINEPFYFIVQGYCYITLKKYALALKSTKKANKTIKNDPLLYNLIAQIYYHTNNYKRALKYFLKAKEAGYNTYNVNYNLAFIYNHNKDTETAFEYANIAINLDNDDGNANYRKGWILGTLCKYDEALKYLLKAEKQGFVSYGIYERIAYLYVNKKNYIKSLQYLDKALSKNKKSNYGNYLKGWILYEKERYNDAQKFLLKAEKYGCKYCDLFAKLSYIFCIEKEYKTSLEYANKALLIDSNNAYANYRKGWALYKLTQYDKAKEYLLKAEKLGYKYYDLFTKLSYIYSVKDNDKNSLKYANKALLMKKDDDYANYRKGWAFYKLEQNDEAIKYFLIAEQLGHKHCSLFYALASMYLNKNELNTALKYANKALLVDNNDAYSNCLEGVILYELGKKKEALKYLIKAKKLKFDYDRLDELIRIIQNLPTK